MTDLMACVWLAPDKAAEAVRLYTRVLPDTEIVSHHRFENPDAPDHSPELWTLRVGEASLQVMGAPEGDAPGFTTSLSLSLTCPDQQSLDRAWDGILEAGGHELQCGWVVDPFGVNWQVIPQAFHELVGSADSDQAQRVVEAVWQMTRIDVEGLRAAAAAS